MLCKFWTTLLSFSKHFSMFCCSFSSKFPPNDDVITISPPKTPKNSPCLLSRHCFSLWFSSLQTTSNRTDECLFSFWATRGSKLGQWTLIVFLSSPKSFSWGFIGGWCLQKKPFPFPWIEGSCSLNHHQLIFFLYAFNCASLFFFLVFCNFLSFKHTLTFDFFLSTTF